MRKRYLGHVEKPALDVQSASQSSPESSPVKPQEPSFNVLSVRRHAKIEDEDEDNRLFFSSNQSVVSSSTSEQQASSAWMSWSASAQSQITHCSNLPFGARAVRPAWSFIDFRME